jgi:anaerobic dimethyl sulfoxide reductase subunit A
MSLARPVRTDPGVKVIRTVCPFGCGIGCGVLAHVKNGMLVKVEPSDHSGTSHICVRGLSATKLVYHPDRLKYPLKRQGARGEGKWQRISWDEALDTIQAKFNDIAAKYGSNSLAFVSTGVGSSANLITVGFAGACQGTFILPAGLGDSAAPCADLACYGAYMWFGEDYTNRFDKPAFCVMWGNNAAVTEPFKWHRLRDAKESGARLVVIDPRFTTTASKADEYIRIRPGTDAALALAMMHIIIERQLQDNAFLTQYTVAPFLVRTDNGMYLTEKDVYSGESQKYMVWDAQTNAPSAYDTPQVVPALTGAYKVKEVECKPAFQLLTELVQQYPPDRAAEITEVPANTIVRLAVEYATRKPTASSRGMGCTRGSLYGDLSYRAINTLAAVTGNLSLRGIAFHQTNPAVFFSRGIPSFITLLQMYQTILTEQPYPIKALWMTRHNLVNQDPNFNLVTGDLLSHLELVVAVDMFMSTSAQYADIVLPACSSYEATDLVAPIGNGSHNYLQLQQKAIEPLHDSRSDMDIYAALAKKMGMDDFLDKTVEEYIEMMLASGHPSMEGITLEKLKESPMLPAPHETPTFTTPSGRMEFYSEKLKEFGQELPVFLEPLEIPRKPLAQKYPLSLSTTHPKYRLHSMFANISWIRELDPEPALDMNPVDAKPRNIKDGDLVRVCNDRGQVKVKVRVHSGTRPGTVNICQGWSPGDYVEGTHQALTHHTLNPAQAVIYEPNAAFYDTAVQVDLAKKE